MTARKPIAVPLPPAEAIVRKLAAKRPVFDSGPSEYCTLCGAYASFEPLTHRATCPWILARQWARANRRKPPRD